METVRDVNSEIFSVKASLHLELNKEARNVPYLSLSLSLSLSNQEKQIRFAEKGSLFLSSFLSSDWQLSE